METSELRARLTEIEYKLDYLIKLTTEPEEDVEITTEKSVNKPMLNKRTSIRETE